MQMGGSYDDGNGGGGMRAPATGSAYRVLLDGCAGWGYTAYVLPLCSRPSLVPVPAHDGLHAAPHAPRAAAAATTAHESACGVRGCTCAELGAGIPARAHARTVAGMATACTRTSVGAGANAGCRDNTTERACAAADYGDGDGGHGHECGMGDSDSERGECDSERE
ncbi:hypothetical protein B0H10DRAFT_2228519 [Mycena sp. CBHHK59/15]|nr:hypothetical protein B0H10DRAFT_2228519 [Mycena sp. CBHHK59/15]